MGTTLNYIGTNSEIGSARRSLAIPSKSIVSLADVFCFVAPALQFVQIQTVGTLLATDLVILAALPIAILRHADRLKQKPVPTILTLGSLWMISQVVTDIVRHSAPEDYLRGWIKIILVLASFIVVWTVVCASLRRFALYGLGVAVGGILTLALHPTDDMIDSPWKFGLAIPTTLLIVLFVSRVKRHWYLGILIPMFILTVVHVFANTRSLALICLLSAAFTLFQMSTAGNKHRIAGGRLILLGGLGAVLI